MMESFLQDQDGCGIFLEEFHSATNEPDIGTTADCVEPCGQQIFFIKNVENWTT